jgi:ACR3 family arsenite efflux pump ArsB
MIKKIKNKYQISLTLLIGLMIILVVLFLSVGYIIIREIENSQLIISFSKIYASNLSALNYILDYINNHKISDSIEKNLNEIVEQEIKTRIFIPEYKDKDDLYLSGNFGSMNIYQNINLDFVYTIEILNNKLKRLRIKIID